MTWSHAVLAFAVSAVCLTGCSRQPSTDATASAAVPASSASTTATPSSGTITVVGDETAPQVAAELRNRGFNVTEDAATLGSATLIVVAEDAANGIRESHRKLTAQLAQNKNPVLWVLTNMSKIDDREMVDLLQTEVQDLLKEHGAANVKLQFAADAEQTTVNAATLKGWPAIADALKAE
jgi:hypothetical protein